MVSAGLWLFYGPYGVQSFLIGQIPALILAGLMALRSKPIGLGDVLVLSFLGFYWGEESFYLLAIVWFAPVMLIGVPFGLLQWWRGYRYPEGHCVRCGYNLTGNVSGVCPECGERI